MRISDWSSDVCSSDLPADQRPTKAASTRRVTLGLPLITMQPVLVTCFRCHGTCRRTLPPGCGSIPAAGGASAFLVETRRRGPASAGPLSDRSVSKPHHQRSEEHTSELQSLMRISYAAFSLQKQH